MSAARRLYQLAKTIRSKNAGVDKITFDVIFPDRASYELVRHSRVLTRDSIAALYGIPLERISEFAEFAPANAIKFTIYRTTPSGSPGDSDVFGCQQYAPLLDVEVPDIDEGSRVPSWGSRSVDMTLTGAGSAREDGAADRRGAVRGPRREGEAD